MELHARVVRTKCVFYREVSPAPGEGGAVLCKVGFLSHLSTLKTFQKGLFLRNGSGHATPEPFHQ